MESLEQQSVASTGELQTHADTTGEENTLVGDNQNNVDNDNSEATGTPGTDGEMAEGNNIPEGDKTLDSGSATLSNEAELKRKLQEYELRDQEIANLKSRLGMGPDVTNEVVQLQGIEATFENQAQTEWVRLCNKYGVDSSPEGFDSSVKSLLEKDPKAYYEFEAQGERLYNSVVSRRNQIVAQRNAYQARQALAPHKTLIENSPSVAKIVNEFVQSNITSFANPQEEINGLMGAIGSIYAEAIEVGKQIAKMEQAQNDTSGVNTSMAGVSAGSYNLQGEHVYTREEIAKMSIDEYAKVADKIDSQRKRGLI